MVSPRGASKETYREWKIAPEEGDLGPRPSRRRQRQDVLVFLCSAREGREVRAEELRRTEHRARASTHVERSLSRDFDKLGDPVEDAHFGGLGKGRACLMREGREGAVGGSRRREGLRRSEPDCCFLPLSPFDLFSLRLGDRVRRPSSWALPSVL